MFSAESSFQYPCQLYYASKRWAVCRNRLHKIRPSPCKSRWNMKNIPELSKRMIAKHSLKIYILPLAAQTFFFRSLIVSNRICYNTISIFNRSNNFLTSFNVTYINEWMLTIIKFTSSNKMFNGNDVLLKR